jgi:hypothetical protein
MYGMLAAVFACTISKRRCFSLQKVIFYFPKGGLLQAKMPPFGNIVSIRRLSRAYKVMFDCSNFYKSGTYILIAILWQKHWVKTIGTPSENKNGSAFRT